MAFGGLRKVRGRGERRSALAKRIANDKEVAAHHA